MTFEALACIARRHGRNLLCAALATGVVAGIAPAQAQQDYPSKTVRIVNSFPPAGPSDSISRAVADKLQGTLKQSFVVENKPGAGGNIGADAVAKAAADGYTVFTGIDTTFTINPNLYRSMPFKPDELKPLMIRASSGLLVGVNPSLGAKTLSEFVRVGKADGLLFSSGSNGSPGHLAAAKAPA